MKSKKHNWCSSKSYSGYTSRSGSRSEGWSGSISGEGPGSGYTSWSGSRSWPMSWSKGS